ncbi:hypothetical protein BGW80DRAFT_1555903 [Lactifluus volemus]|nr:hypothetical protein BGW80DRAFT_1555903 [Lactifluus volemus]
MSARSFAKQAAAAFSKEKPRSSITEWVDILTSSSYDDEVYDGIPELIQSIDLQVSGPTEASRAIRKKIKHGDTHQQYRALVVRSLSMMPYPLASWNSQILNALVENAGQKFQSSFADTQLTDALRNLATDSATDRKVKKKVLAVLASWSRQFKDDRSAAGIASLYRQVKSVEPSRGTDVNREASTEREREAEARQKEKEVAKRKAKEERLRREEEARRKKAASKKATATREHFDVEREKPQVLTAIANASSAANNLMNAITLVNTENDSLLSNERVQEWLFKAKQARKSIVRYIQLVEDEEIIGTLIETNDRIIAVLESYDKLSKPNVTEKDIEEVQQGLEAAHISGSEVHRLQEKQRAAVQRAVRQRSRLEDDTPGSQIHIDLHDLSFGTLGPEHQNLPPPIRPTTHSPDENQVFRRGSLSDFSDYESSDEGAHRRVGQSSAVYARKAYINVSDDDRDAKEARQHITENEDPFADPFAD